MGCYGANYGANYDVCVSALGPPQAFVSKKRQPEPIVWPYWVITNLLKVPVVHLQSGTLTAALKMPKTKGKLKAVAIATSKAALAARIVHVTAGMLSTILIHKEQHSLAAPAHYVRINQIACAVDAQTPKLLKLHELASLVDEV